MILLVGVEAGGHKDHVRPELDQPGYDLLGEGLSPFARGRRAWHQWIVAYAAGSVYFLAGCLESSVWVEALAVQMN